MTMSLINSVSGIYINSIQIVKNKSVSNDEKKKDREKEVQQEANNINIQESWEEKLFERLKAIALKLGITVNNSDSIGELIAKIQRKLKELEQEDKNNSNLNAIKSEFESIKQAFQSLLNGDNSLVSGMDILSQSNRAAIGI